MNLEVRIEVTATGGSTEVRVTSTPSPRCASPAPPAAHSLPPIVGHRSLHSVKKWATAPRSPAPPALAQAGGGAGEGGGRRSRYHSGCCDGSRRELTRVAAAPSASAAQIIRPPPNPCRRAGNLAPDVGGGSRAGGEMEAGRVTEWLQKHPEYLADFVSEHVELDVLERWLVRKMKTDKSSRKNSQSHWNFCVHADKRKMLQEVMDSLKRRPTRERVVWELARCVAAAVGADGWRLAELQHAAPEHLTIYLQTQDGEEMVTESAPAASRPAALEAARQNRPLRLSRRRDRHRYPGAAFCSDPDAEHVLYQPIVQPDGESAVVLEMWRREGFRENDEELCASYLVWGGIALHYAHLYLSMDKQRDLADFLLTVVKSIFQDMVSMEAVVTKVMNFAQKLVHADRASLFLVDSKSKELYATVFDVGVDGDNNSCSGSEGSISKSKAVKEIRFPVGTGIAGHVAETGEVLNIKDAYDDDRFNRTVDVLTGYKTKTILCMPIYIRNAIIGVVQMVNKKAGHFTKVDEKSFEMFAVYCGLALHHAKLYDKIKRSEQKYKVALEVLSYHNTCTEEEVEVALQDVQPAANLGLDDFYFSPFMIGDYEKASHAIYMFTDLFGLQYFDRSSVIKFVLTVKKNYRRVPYHNWTHGFSVANCMYNILKNSDVFSRNEQLSLFTGALCHDLDHRGKNNKFMSDTASPLAAIYSTSTMEHHHFNQTVTILQQEGHNIFSKLSSADYKHVLSLVKQCILATDLAMFFSNRARLAQLVKDAQFKWTKPDHRSLVLAISMTASDLSASAKPWDIQVETVKVIFQEFYEQGDAERAAGRKPIPMMDRRRPEEQAASQVGFLTGICVPCYSLLVGLIPQTRPLLEMCERNLRQWTAIDREVAVELESHQGAGAGAVISKHLYIKTDVKN